MFKLSRAAAWVLSNPVEFGVRVIRGFRANQGILLAGAVAYYTLLSIVPIMALLLIGLSQFYDRQELLSSLQQYLSLVTPGEHDALLEQVRVFLDDWKVIGFMGLILMLFFSSFAFTALENAMSVIFFHRVSIQRRHFLISAIIPYLYILFLGAGLLLVSVVSGGLHAMHDETLRLFGRSWSLSGLEGVLIYLLGVAGEVLLLTSLYMVMPVGRLSVRHALIGGVTAAILWEITRHILVWYFSTLSLVNIIYGAFGTVVIILLSLEVAAIILLLGAQIIAEYERIGRDQARSRVTSAT